MNGWTALSTSLVERLVERQRSRQLAVLEPDRGGVTRLDLDDAACRGEQLLRLDRRRGAVVGADPGVLEGLSQLEKAGLVLERELDRRGLDGLAAEV